jgi:hypothetical protein
MFVGNCIARCEVLEEKRGVAALEGPQRASRMVMFRLYYLGLTPYERARHFLGLSERGWVNGLRRYDEGAGRRL